MPIKSFRDQMTADVADGLNTKNARRLPQRVWTAAHRRLSALRAAQSTHDLNAESLAKTKPGYFSMRVNDQYRIHFQFRDGDAYDVHIIGEDHTGRRGR